MLQILFAGTPQLSANILQQLVTTNHNIIGCLTQPDKPAGRGQKLHASPVKQYAIQNNIPVYQPATLKTLEIQTLLTKLKPDVAVVVAYGLMIPQQLLTIPKYGFINIHMSLLPRWRGASPIQHAILSGDKETGVTIMQMDPQLDAGDILAATSLPILTEDTSYSLQTKLEALGMKELITLLKQLPLGNIHPIKQDHTKATYAHKINKQHAKINWDQSAEDIDRQIRAYDPWPISFTQHNNTTIRVWEALPIESNHHSMPGTILAVSKQGIDVATTDGAIRLQKIQLPNKKPLLVEEIIKANKQPFTPGIVLQC